MELFSEDEHYPSYVSKIRIYMLLDGKICQQPRKGSDKTGNSFIINLNWFKEYNSSFKIIIKTYSA